MSLTLKSSAFDSGESIPTKYTCEGVNVSPPFSWEGVPQDTDRLVLICDDPDASSDPGGPFSHWVLYDLPTDQFAIPEGYSPGSDDSPDGVEGRNSFGNLGYDGPCPPSGTAHNYVFRFYALSGDPELPPGANRAQVLDSIDEHIIENTEYYGTYASSG